MTTTGWLDLSSGAAGDMLLGAYLDAGADRAGVETALGALGLRLAEERVTRGGLAARRAVPVLPDGTSADADPGERSWADLRALLDAAPLDPPVRALALEVLQRLVAAEATVHGVGSDEVHLHEAGGLDALGDVVGVCAAHLSLGVDRLVGSSIALGGGQVRAAHGALPVPVPAVVELLRGAGAPVHGGPVDRELCTPTGAALLAVLVDTWGGLPAGQLTASGLGAGAADLPGQVNAVRLLVLSQEEASPRGVAVLLECNVDDLDPRLWPHVLDRLLAAGADDAWLTPVLMKKGRPAHALSVLCAPDRADALRAIVVRETSTLGLREQTVGKHALPRRVERVLVRGREVRIKLGLDGHRVLTAQPEWADVAAAAESLALPAKQVLAEAVAAAQRLDGVVEEKP